MYIKIIHYVFSKQSLTNCNQVPVQTINLAIFLQQYYGHLESYFLYENGSLNSHFLTFRKRQIENTF